MSDDFRADRFTSEAGDFVFLDQYLHPLQQQHNQQQGHGLKLGDGVDEAAEEALTPWQPLEEDEPATKVCEGPFWPSPDDPDTGYCTCCERVYQGDLRNHPCLSDQGDDDDDELDEEEEFEEEDEEADDDEDTAKQVALKLV